MHLNPGVEDRNHLQGLLFSTLARVCFKDWIRVFAYSLLRLVLEDVEFLDRLSLMIDTHTRVVSVWVIAIFLGFGAL